MPDIPNSSKSLTAITMTTKTAKFPTLLFQGVMKLVTFFCTSIFTSVTLENRGKIPL